MTADDSADQPVSTFSFKPLVYFFHEGEEVSSTPPLLERLGLRCDTYFEPRAFLQSLKKVRPAVCIIDLTTPSIEVATALIKAIRSVLGPDIPILAVVPPDGQSMIDKIAAGGSTSWIEIPINDSEFARKLGSYVSTEAIAKLSQGRTASGLGAGAAATTPTGDSETPPAIAWILEKVVPLLVELGHYVQFFDDAEQQLKFYIERFAGYEEEISTMVQRIRRKPERLDPMQSLRAFGVAPSRNLLATAALADLTVPGSFGFDAKSGLPTHDPKTVIPYAMRAVERFGEGSKFFQYAFSAGLVMDVLVRMSLDLGERKRLIQRTAEASYQEAIRRIEKGFKLGKQAEDLAMAKHIITTLMMREAGKLAMAIFFENYLEVRKFFDKKVVSHPFQLIAEVENYGISHNIAAAIICQAAPNLSDAYLSALFCDVPVRLKGDDEKDLQALAAFCRSM